MARTKKNSKRQRRKRKLILFIIEIIILILVAGALFVYSKLDLIKSKKLDNTKVEKMRFPKKLRKHLKDILLLHVLVWTTVNRVFTSPVTVM